MKILLIADTHFGIRNDSPVFHEYFKKSLKYFFDFIDTNNINHVIHLGDLFDRRKYLSFLTSSVCRNEFLTPLQERNIQTHIIAGNHDHYYKDTYEVNALDEIVGTRYPCIKTYNLPELINIDGLDIQLLPWINQKNRQVSFDTINNTKAPILIGHLELNGFEMFKGTVSDHGIDKNVFTKFESVFSGHYHHKSSKDNIHYIGAFAEYIWSDYNDPRGFTLLDTQTRKFEFIQNPHNIFKMMSYDDVKHPDIIQKIQNTDYSNYKDCYVKVLCMNKTNQFAFDLMLDMLYKAGPIDISIIEDMSLLVDSDETETIDQVQDTPTILSNYIKSLTLNVDNDKMISFMRDIYAEALATEHIE